MTDISEAVYRHVEEQIARSAERLEWLLADAIKLQDYDRIDQLTVIYQDGCAPTVASLI